MSLGNNPINQCNNAISKNNIFVKLCLAEVGNTRKISTACFRSLDPKFWGASGSFSLLALYPETILIHLIVILYR